MAISRKTALERIQKFMLRAEEHLAKARENPGHSSLRKWTHEARHWLRQIEELLTHVGQKTATEWQTQVEELRSRYEEELRAFDEPSGEDLGGDL